MVSPTTTKKGEFRAQELTVSQLAQLSVQEIKHLLPPTQRVTEGRQILWLATQALAHTFGEEACERIERTQGGNAVMTTVTFALGDTTITGSVDYRNHELTFMISDGDIDTVFPTVSTQDVDDYPSAAIRVLRDFMSFIHTFVMAIPSEGEE